MIVSLQPDSYFFVQHLVYIRQTFSLSSSLLTFERHRQTEVCRTYRPIRQLPIPFRRPPFCRLHESRSANPFPSRSAQSARCSSPRCPRASPSRPLPVRAPLPSPPSP